ncbi:MAG: hypothetical protein ACM37W_09160 [Actinomycetota bacterium]
MIDDPADELKGVAEFGTAIEFSGATGILSKPALAADPPMNFGEIGTVTDAETILISCKNCTIGIQNHHGLPDEFDKIIKSCYFAMNEVQG